MLVSTGSIGLTQKSSTCLVFCCDGFALDVWSVVTLMSSLIGCNEKMHSCSSLTKSWMLFSVSENPFGPGDLSELLCDDDSNKLRNEKTFCDEYWQLTLNE